MAKRNILTKVKTRVSTRTALLVALALVVVGGLAYVVTPLIQTEKVPEGINIASLATVTVSSEAGAAYAARNAVDGKIGKDKFGEWISTESNPWIKLDWGSTPKTINSVVLYDRTSTKANIPGGMLYFSDGSTMMVKDMYSNGSPKVVKINPAKTVTSVKFAGVGGKTANNGLSEIKVIQTMAKTTIPTQGGKPATPLQPLQPTTPLDTNIAPKATVTASSEYAANYSVKNVNDGNKKGGWAPGWEQNPWVKLTWSSPQTINKIIVYSNADSPSGIPKSTLTFSDGSSINVVGIVPGSPKEITFLEKTITSVEFKQITAGTKTTGMGVSEIEVFRASLINLAPLATVTVSSEYSYNYNASCAVNSAIGSYGGCEWVSKGEKNPWIQLTWGNPNPQVTINKIVFYGAYPDVYHIPGTDIPGGTLTFSDGSSINVTGISPDGKAKIVTFPGKTVSWVKFQSVGGKTINNGLAEIQVFKVE